MKIQELKEKVLGAIEEAGKFTVLSVVTDIFNEFDQSNKSEELPKDFSWYHEIQSMKNEIETLKKQVEAIDKIKIIDNSIEPKQERFKQYIRFELREGKQGEPFDLYDNSRINKWVCNIGSKEDAYRILDALNSLEASKNDNT